LSPGLLSQEPLQAEQLQPLLARAGSPIEILVILGTMAGAVSLTPIPMIHLTSVDGGPKVWRFARAAVAKQTETLMIVSAKVELGSRTPILATGGDTGVGVRGSVSTEGTCSGGRCSQVHASKHPLKIREEKESCVAGDGRSPDSKLFAGWLGMNEEETVMRFCTPKPVIALASLLLPISPSQGEQSQQHRAQGEHPLEGGFNFRLGDSIAPDNLQTLGFAEEARGEWVKRTGGASLTILTTLHSQRIRSISFRRDFQRSTLNGATAACRRAAAAEITRLRRRYPYLIAREEAFAEALRHGREFRQDVLGYEPAPNNVPVRLWERIGSAEQARWVQVECSDALQEAPRQFSSSMNIWYQVSAEEIRQSRGGD
jgi:hypothetical protein